MNGVHFHTCCLCEAMCGLEIEVADGRVAAIRPDRADVLSRGHICPKAVALKDLHEDPDRLRQPMRRTGSGWEPISWEDALDEATARLAAVRERHGRDAMALYLGNPAAHSHTTLLGLAMFVLAVPTRNRYSATSADQLPHMLASLLMFGHQLLLPIPDIDHTDLFVIFGGNPAVSNGSLMTAPGAAERIKAIRQRGGRVWVFDPRRTETAELADRHVFLRPGTDALALLGVLSTLFEEGLVAGGEWRQHVTGLDELQRAARRFTAERVAEATAVPAPVLRELARALAASRTAAVYGRVGLCTQRFGGLAAWAVHALNTVTGNLDRPGGVGFPQPAVDIVGLASRLGQRGHFGGARSRVSGLPEFSDERPVSALAEEIETPGDGQIRALLTVAGNPVLSIPNGGRLDRALAGLEYMVSLDPYINETTRHAHLILPPPSPLERDHFGVAFHALAVRNTIKHDRAIFAPGPGVRLDGDTLLELAARLADGSPRNWSAGIGARLAGKLGWRRILDLALRTGPHGAGVLPFNRKGLTLARVEAAPHGIDLGALVPSLLGRLETPDKRIRLAPEPYVRDLDRLERALQAGELAPRNGELFLIGRRQLRSNNSWMHNSPRLMKGKNRCTLLMHPDDAAARGFTSGQTIRVASRVGAVQIELQVSDEIMPGVVSLPHGWGHDRAGVQLSVAGKTPGVSLNDLTDERHVDALTGTAGFSGVPVSVEAVA